MKTVEGVAFQNLMALYYKTWQNSGGSCHKAMVQSLHQLAKGGAIANSWKCKFEQAYFMFLYICSSLASHTITLKCINWQRLIDLRSIQGAG